ncbi:MAG: energy-coupling factor transporter ATPase [Acutalibacteraceae bacterium]
MSFIEVQNVSFRYDSLNENETESLPLALNHVSLKIEKGEFLAIVGHNGSGKSTLSKMLNAIYLPTEGSVIVDGMNTADSEHLFDIRKNVGLVQQNPDNQIVAGIVEEDVAFGCENLGMSPKEIRRRVDDALKAVDMYDYRMYSPEKLSGGQKQRVAIAGILAMQPQCIVLDEPTAMLDPKGRTEVMETIHDLNRRQGITIVLITHYMEEAVEADRVIVADGGQILLTGKPIEVFSQVELLKEHRLDVPQATELAYRLQKSGFDMPCVLNEEMCAKQIARLFGKRISTNGGV